MSAGRAVAEHRWEPERLQDVLEFLKRTRSELRMLRKVRVSREWVRIFDINGDWFEVSGVGYPDADVVAVLRAVNTPFNPETIHEPRPFLMGPSRMTPPPAKPSVRRPLKWSRAPSR